MRSRGWEPEPRATTRKDWERSRDRDLSTLLQLCAKAISRARAIQEVSVELRRQSAMIRDSRFARVRSSS